MQADIKFEKEICGLDRLATFLSEGLHKWNAGRCAIQESQFLALGAFRPPFRRPRSAWLKCKHMQIAQKSLWLKGQSPLNKMNTVPKPANRTTGVVQSRRQEYV